MNLFVFIANAWGAVSGGINCFNSDLTIACARVKKNDNNTKICCVVPGISDDDKKMMKNEGIIPITLSKEAFSAPEASRLIFESIKKENKLRHYYPDCCNTFYIGHDIYTGELSKRLADESDGWNVVFHHMDYASYYLFKKPNIDDYNSKIQQQTKVLCDADLICAVGPMLAESAQDKARTNPDVKIIEVFPGLAEFSAIQDAPKRFSPIVFGRVEEDNQRIKQIVLAIDAFAKAIYQDHITPIMGNNSKLNVIGYEDGDSEALEEEVRRLQESANKIAGRLCNIVPLPYTTDREKLGRSISEASVAMMLSFHEGFGLVGYEAIAAGVPLILSRNTGLYMFLEREQLDYLVYSVDIEGSVDTKGYSQNDLDTVTRALRDIRQNESKRKEDALKLRDALRLQKDKYSWKAVAKSFIDRVLEAFEADLKNESIVFFRPDELTMFNVNLDETAYDKIMFEPYSGCHVYTVEGENALISLHMCLQEQFGERYSVFIYSLQSGTDENFLYSDFLSDCRTFFGKKGDSKGSEFKYILGERLNDTILILNDFPANYVSCFSDLFSSLNEQKYNFYIFTIFKTNLPTTIKPYHNCTVSQTQDDSVIKKVVPEGLTNEQKLLVKILSFCGKSGYSKKLIKYIYNGINWYCSVKGNPQIFKDTAKIEEDLLKLGFIEVYSEYSYQNSSTYLEMDKLEVESESYAFGISRLGSFYSRCYRLNRDRDPQLRWGYFSCKCFLFAAGLSDKIKENIKTDYEAILIAMRRKAMDTSDYSRYYNALQSFIDEYKEPDNLWIWYHLIHCESLCCPKMETLKKTENILKTKFATSKVNCREMSELKVQFIRLCAELEYELDIPDSLEHFIARINKLSSDSKVGTPWAQCLATLINLAINQKKYSVARKYLDDYKKINKTDDMYLSVIATAMETRMEIARYTEDDKVDLSVVLPNIEKAFYIARNRLKDYRAQGWVLGLWGECQILMKDQNGEKNLWRSMKHRKISGEKTKEYRNWLQRILKYELQQNTRTLLDEEIARTGLEP